MSEHLRKVKIYTDGACKPNPGNGGWAALLIDLKTDRSKEIMGSVPDTTNNQMELFAILQAIDALKMPCDITLYTDSNLAVGWLTKASRINQPHIRKLCARIWAATLKNHHKVTYVWIRGHNGNPNNGRVNDLAQYQALRDAQ